MPQLQALLFDLDGTLIDSAPDICQAINLMLAEAGRPAVSLEQVKAFSGEGSMELCRKCLETSGSVGDQDIFPYVQKFIARYRTIKPDPAQVFPHTREVLELLQTMGVKMGVCTNKTEASTHYLLKDLGLDRYFGFVAGGDTFTVHKPNPGHILGVLEALEAAPENALFVGDGPNDVVACLRAGIPCIVVTHGYASNEATDEMSGNRTIEGFDQLEAAILGLGFTY